ncbi:HNH endonuclease signature motif containing protein [Geodermatophilus sp. SYSU D01180]
MFGPDGTPLDLGREQRLASRHIRRAAELRDGGCVFAGCGAPTWWCDVHHLIHWIDGGDTSLDNSALLCERHHTKVHHGFRVERQPTGTWRTYRPDGTEITTRPPSLAPAA